jgi:alanine racemase
MSSKGCVLVHGQKAPIIGRVCMDLIMIDVGHIPEVKIEDEVVIFGHQGNASITVDEIAKSSHTINYEVVTRISNRVPRVYI